VTDNTPGVNVIPYGKSDATLLSFNTPVPLDDKWQSSKLNPSD